ncbi:hypothetical protein M569_09525, partial [Genlisea aurea]
MAGLQRSSISFRRQGSSGLVWDDKLLAGEFNQRKEEEEEDGVTAEKSEIKVEIVETKKPDPETKPAAESGYDGGIKIAAGNVSPTIDPPSPKVSVCGFCSAFSK